MPSLSAILQDRERRIGSARTGPKVSDYAVDGIRIALAVAFVVGMVACATQAALLKNGGNRHDHLAPLPHMRRIYRLAGFLSLLAALGLLARV